VTGTRSSTSATPNPHAQSSVPSRVTDTAMPGIRCACIRESSRAWKPENAVEPVAPACAGPSGATATRTMARPKAGAWRRFARPSCPGPGPGRAILTVARPAPGLPRTSKHRGGASGAAGAPVPSFGIGSRRLGATLGGPPSRWAVITQWWVRPARSPILSKYGASAKPGTPWEVLGPPRLPVSPHVRLPKPLAGSLPQIGSLVLSSVQRVTGRQSLEPGRTR
jgi:hypothetical protein